MIYLNDFLKAAKDYPDEYFDVIIADPPYNIGKDFGNDSDKQDIKDYIEWSILWMSECDRLLKKTGTFYIYGFSEILAHLSVNTKLDHRWLIWSYTNKTIPLLNFWQRTHESILCCWKGKERIFNRDSVRVPYTETFLNNAAGKTRKATKSRFQKSEKETTYSAHENGALPRDVISVPALAGGAGKKERFFYCKDCDDIFPLTKRDEHSEHKIIEHPTQKPRELTKILLNASKPLENGKLLVPFSGTGSEVSVGKELGMESVGYDLNEDYVKMGNILVNKTREPDGYILI